MNEEDDKDRYEGRVAHCHCCAQARGIGHYMMGIGMIGTIPTGFILHNWEMAGLIFFYFLLGYCATSDAFHVRHQKKYLVTGERCTQCDGEDDDED